MTFLKLKPIGTVVLSYDERDILPGKVPCIIHPKVDGSAGYGVDWFFNNHEIVRHNDKTYTSKHPGVINPGCNLQAASPKYPDLSQRTLAAEGFHAVAEKIATTLGFEDCIVLMYHKARKFSPDDDYGLWWMEYRFTRDEDRTLWGMATVKPYRSLKFVAEELGVWS